jgi:hypothetical protein
MSALIGAATGGIGGGLIKGFKWGTKTTKFWNLSWRKFNTVSKRLRKANDLVGKDVDLHHVFFKENSRVPGWLKNNPLNLNVIPRETHRKIHQSKNPFFKWFYGTPSWGKAVELSGFGTSAGFAYDQWFGSTAGDGCGCN